MLQPNIFLIFCKSAPVNFFVSTIKLAAQNRLTLTNVK